jgi:hypothetical protein
MDKFGAAEAMLYETRDQYQAARNQREIEQLKDSSLYTLHVECRYTHYHQANMADAGVSQHTAQVALPQGDHGGVDKGEGS